MVDIPEMKIDVTKLGFSEDSQNATFLYNWYNEKHSRCRKYKKLLGMCLNQDMVSEDQVDPTPLVELLRQVGWEDLKIKMFKNAGMMDKYKLSLDKCRIFNSLVSICHADNIFPKDHMSSSLLWVSQFINNAWDNLNETDSQTPSLESYIREKRSIVEPQSQNQTTALIILHLEQFQQL